jgi:hypothetical protein
MFCHFSDILFLGDTIYTVLLSTETPATETWMVSSERSYKLEKKLKRLKSRKGISENS